MDEKLSWAKNFFNRIGGRDTPHRPIFSTCVEPTLESAAILMKFTQDVRMNEKILWAKIRSN